MKFLSFLSKHRYILFTICIFCFHIFFSFFELERRAAFGWDQINNAWAAHRILVEGKYPLLGMVAKGNSGIYIGPLYYYLVAIFYFFTHLDPIASPILAGVTSVFSFFVLYYVGVKLFNPEVCVMSLVIYTFSSFVIRSERIQWPVNFIAPLSLLILYFLSQVIRGKWKYLLYLALAMGLSFHIHFTSIFYLAIIALAIPIIPFNKLIWKHIVWATGIFFVCFIPQILYYFQTLNADTALKYGAYFETYYHGLHLRRVLQLLHDAFIQFESILLPFRFLRNTVFFYLPIFFILYIKENSFKKSWKILYLFSLWIFVPWIILSTYRGELTDYYFF